MKPESLLELDRVTVSRSQFHLLDDITLRIPLGQNTVILGPNGSGKSSLLKLLMRQFYPSIVEGDAGTVRIFGQSLWNNSDLRSRLGIICGELDQEFSSPRSGRMTGLQAVLSGLDGVKIVGAIRDHDSRDLDIAHDSLARAGAMSLAGQTLATMSTGERRRVLIARALVHQPAALLVDEPTTGLDIAARLRFLDQLQTLAENGTTIVLVTHHIEEVIPAISHVIFLKRGKTVGEGPVTELLTDSNLSDLFDVRVCVHRSDLSWSLSRP